MNTRSVILTVLIAGVVIGVLGNLPVLNLINCALCIWVWVGGSLAVFLYRRFQGGKASLSVGQGAGLGALSGLVGAVVGSIVYLVTSPISVPLFNSLARALHYEGDLPFRSSTLWDYVSSAFIFLVIDAVLYPLFGALGGLITASLTKTKEPLPESGETS
jgi:ABC-type Co2+ transport system permease subunit